VTELGIDDKVRFYGRAAHHEVPVLLHNHDVYVQPSIKHPETLQEEGQPIAVLEAIATGMPVIVTETGGMAETVRVGEHEGHAWIVPDKSARAISEALREVIHAPGSAARQRAYVDEISAKHAREQQLARTRLVYERAWAAAGQADAVVVPSERGAR
jgi:glycosyltransferase involved in cell wall biosynthesis